MTLEDGTDTLSRNVRKELPLHTAYPRGVHISSTLWQKPEITQVSHCF